MVDRFDVYLVSLDAAPSKDAKNTRLCVVVSPNEVNHSIPSVIVAPISSGVVAYPTRVEVNILNSPRSAVLDQLRTVDRTRLVKKVGELSKIEQSAVLKRLAEMFAE